MGGAVASGQQVLVEPSVGVANTNTIVLTPTAFNQFPAFDGTDVTITLSGFTLSSTAMVSGRVSMQNVAGGGTSVNQAIYMPTGMHTTTTTRLAITRPFPGVTNTVATVGFTTTSAIVSGDVIRIFFPNGFFINAPSVTTCDATTSSYSLSATDGASSCNQLTTNVIVNDSPTTNYLDVTYTTGTSAAGAQSIVLSGMTLSTAAVPSSNTFYVVTTTDTCSAGMIATGAISNANPGGPGASPSTGASAALSAAVAVMCTLLFWL